MCEGCPVKPGGQAVKFYEISREIAAPPTRVWAVLTDARALVTGGLGLVKLEGTIAPGARLVLSDEGAPGRAFRLRVTEFAPPSRMVWEGGMPLGLFRGARKFNLTPASARTLFDMREEYTGLMLPLIWSSMPDLNPPFAKFADGLRKLAEA